MGYSKYKDGDIYTLTATAVNTGPVDRPDLDEFEVVQLDMSSITDVWSPDDARAFRRLSEKGPASIKFSRPR